jgi:hypothetical protein
VNGHASLRGVKPDLEAKLLQGGGEVVRVIRKEGITQAGLALSQGGSQQGAVGERL